MRRTTVLAAAATTAVLALLTGCRGDDAPAGDAAAFDPAEAVAKAGQEPYAVTVDVVRAPDGDAEPVVLTARQNLNTLFTGRWQGKEADGTLRESVTTADAEYLRGHDATGTWLKTPRSAEVSDFDYNEYARLLLAQGPSARKGMETRDGVPTYHLAGHLEAAQFADAAPSVHRALTRSGITSLDLDQWIDAQGRTRHVDERVVADGEKVAITLAFSDFGPAETFAAPSPVAD
ncbi:hypothetical protein ACFVFS_08045 [Kitasatospora sp. NPDC057692]|uniref:hypothetical protein n=1 Tax=Kitasatospora sp. NPDC057692 TaxID=3346215 RepID=UPI00368EA23A